MTMTQRGSSLCKAKLARQIEQLRENGETACDDSNHLDTDYVVVERNWYGFCAVFIQKRL